MPRFSRLLAALPGALLLLTLSLAPAMAQTASGSHAWSTTDLLLRDGPGTAYAQTGAEIAADVPVMVQRCQKLWCLVDANGARGWTSKQYIDFGRGPSVTVVTALSVPACFYSGTNYSGSEVCLPSGRVIQDLALLGLDNGFASVRIDGPGSVSVCRDRFFQSYCERITVSQPALDPYLFHNASSIRVN